MKRKLLFISMLFVEIAVMADSSNLTVQDVERGCGHFFDNKNFYPEQYIKARYEDGTELEISAADIRNILDLNVVSFYRIPGYDTDLKKELFKETDEYKQYETKLKKIRDKMLQKSFCYTQEIRNVYDVEKGGFKYDIILSEDDYVNFPGYINHRTLCIEYATKRFPKNKMEITKWWGGTFYNYTQRVFFPVPDKRVALQIEEAKREHVKVLFIFKIDSTEVKRPGIWPKTFVLTKTESIYIINSKTGKVYYKVL